VGFSELFNQASSISAHFSVLVTVRLAPVMATTVAFADFPDVKKASEAVAEIMNQGVGIRTFEPI
jgi:hypothetical protein